MNIITWNVNGVRANHKKDIFPHIFNNPKKVGFSLDKLDIVALQETKATYAELGPVFSPAGYITHYNSATERKGYSGVSIYVREDIEHKVLALSAPEFVSFETLKTEGRLLCLEFKDFFFINCYFPNGGGKPERLDYKIQFYLDFIEFCKKLQMLHTKHVVFCGDLNIAHNEIDLARPKQNENTVGFLRKERDLLDMLHNEGFIDVFRLLYPETVTYSWWDMKTRSRDRNIGWRIDGFYTDMGFMRNIQDTQILGEVIGSDHCPVLLALKQGLSKEGKIAKISKKGKN